MTITIVATKTCSHRAMLEDRLRELGAPYTVQFVEEHPEVAERHEILRSPTLLLDDQVVFQREPNHPVPQLSELKTLLNVDCIGATMSTVLKRKERRDQDTPAQMVPQPIPGKPDLMQVDTTWGEIQSMQAAPGVRTVDELELIEHLEQGLPVVDARTRDFHEQSTIPGATNVPYPDIADRMDALDREQATIFFCNGPQCPQSSRAIKALLEADYPAEKILYYRGGMHDWLTLGLPVVPGVETLG